VQAHIQFAHNAQGCQFMQYAIKFFLRSEDFETEAAFYCLPEIAATMPPLKQICDNSDDSVCSTGGYTYPPFIVVERGITLSAVRTLLLREDSFCCVPHSK
jgi:hypothetical protein